MSNYSKTTDFAAKDALTTGNANKIVKGTEIDDEFDAIQTAVNSKANANSAALTGTPTAPTADAATNTTQIATTAFVATTFAAKASPALTGTPTAPTADAATDTTQIATTAFVQAAAALLYPVGSIYSNVAVATNPATLLGFGTWTAFGAGRVMVGLDGDDEDFDTVGETGGAKTHTLTTSEMPAHTHTYVEDYSTNAYGPNATGIIKDGTRSKNTGSTGGGTAHNNLQPYITVYMWQRTV
jgi:hypothetical protein